MIPPTLATEMQTYPKLIESCDVSLVDLEWRQLGLKGEHSDIKDTTLFWKAQLSTLKSDGTPAYPNLTKLIGAALSLPHSNAAVERIFSELRLIKTDIRNCLSCPSLVSLIHTKHGLERANISAHQLLLNAKLRSALKCVKSNATAEKSATNVEKILQE